MNRQAKRMMQRQKATGQDRMEAMRQRKAVTTERSKRTPPRRFVKEVAVELRKVNWPTRREVFAYTVVVMVAVVVLTALVFGLDIAFSRGILNFFSPGP
ncbi:MAG TPA: preprotein translocase subunit SecE [Actinomycetota bacterium]|jgi:preprotein translocase subunit SecE|nr:preprotein translocase subunit SecE [Actinomycetota bacterium]